MSYCCTFFNTAHLLSKDVRLELGAPNLFLAPGAIYHNFLDSFVAYPLKTLHVNVRMTCVDKLSVGERIRA